LFLLQKVKFKEIRKNCSYIIIYYYISYIIIYKQFFLIFLNLTFCKRNNVKIILLIIFVFSLFFLYQTVILQNKKVYINIYGHTSYI